MPPNGHLNGHANGHVRANGHAAPHGHANGHANGHATGHLNGHARALGPDLTPVRPSAPSPRLGAPRTPPVGEERVFRPDEAALAGPANQRVYLWSPRCRYCGHAMRNVAEVPAPAEGPDRGSLNFSWHNVLCAMCRNDNPLGPMTAWSVVGGPLPVR